MKKLLLFLLFACCFVTHSAYGQQPSGLHSFGQDFYLTELTPSINCPDMKSYQEYYALITAFYNCSVTLSYFMSDGRESVGGTYQIQAANGVQVPLDQSYMNPKDANGNPINPNGQIPEYTACRIHSTRPISVAYYSNGPNSGAMTMILPTSALGKNYVVASLPDNPGEGAAIRNHLSNSNCITDSGCSEFGILAISANTTVTIIPNGLTQTGDTGTNSGPGASGAERLVHVELSRGQVYWVKSAHDATNDMSGSLVMANAPIAVFAGNSDAFHGMSDIADLGGDQRNVFVQQMVPTQYWRSKDYLSMPFKDNPSLSMDNASIGDELKIYASDSVLTSLNVAIDSNGTSSAYLSLPNRVFAAFGNVQNTANTSANDKIQVEQYDYKAQSNKDPNTSPTMMNVVPLQNYGRTFSFLVPNDRSLIRMVRYMNIIVRKDQLARTFVTQNNGTTVRLNALVASAGPYTIPGHAELIGLRYILQPGAYMVRGDSAFIVYQYGMLGIDPDNDLGDNDDDDYYFEYAAPAGESFGMDGAGIPFVSVDTVCDGWNITARDTAQADGGIASIQILNDPLGLFARIPGKDSGYVSSNVNFSVLNYTSIPGSIVDTTSIRVDNPLMDATAYVLITNAAGRSVLCKMSYNSPNFALVPGSLPFLNTKVDVDSCATIVLRNLDTGNTTGVLVSSSSIKFGNQGFHLAAVNPPLPYNLKPGNSVEFVVCFDPQTTAQVSNDMLSISLGCQTAWVPLMGTSQLGAIVASDYDFGKVLVGDTATGTVRVWNSGSAPFTLTRQWTLDNPQNFTFLDTALLPSILGPGQNINLRFSYSPTEEGVEDTATVDWGTDLPSPYSEMQKHFSGLRGSGIAPHLEWDSPILFFASGNARVRRATLHNYGTAPITVDTVEIIGPDTSEFHIIANQNNYLPLNPMTTRFVVYPRGSENFDTTQWIDVEFSPDTTIPRDRVDTLIALDQQGIHPLVVLNGMIGNLAVSAGAVGQLPKLSLKIIGEELQASLPSSYSEGGTAQIYDELGREVLNSRIHSSTLSLSLATLPNGTYYLHVAAGGKVSVVPFQWTR